MEEQIVKQFLDNISLLSQSQKEEIAKKLNVKTIQKGTIIQQEGRIVKECFFVLSGCVRQFNVSNDNEKTLEFFTSDHGAIPSESYVQKTPSNFSLECVTESVLLVGDSVTDQKMFSEFPILRNVIAQMIEAEWSKSQNKLSQFKHSKPEERYLDLLENRPNLLNQVPSHQIASYLGITPESLSRIRKRISLS